MGARCACREAKATAALLLPTKTKLDLATSSSGLAAAISSRPMLGKMRPRLIVCWRLAVLSLLAVLALWYRDTLLEGFEPIQRFFPAPGESACPCPACVAAVSDWC